MKLSVIVPVYNVERYVERCIKSILEQKLNSDDKLEIVIVNDGSKDKSMAVIKNMIEPYDNVLVVEQDNQGLSMARNAGLSKCSGDCIWFVDSDDYIQPDSVNQLLSVFKSNTEVDVISFHLNNIAEESNEITTSRFNKCLKDSNILTGADYLFLRGAFAPVQRFAFRRSLLLNNNFRFYPGIYHEDGEFGVRVLYSCRKIYLLNKPLYNYILRSSGSIMSSIKIKNIYDLMTVYMSLKDYGEAHVANEDNKYWKALIAQWFIFMFDYARKFINTTEFKELYNKNKDEINSNILNVLYAKQMNYRMSVVAILIRFVPSLYMMYVSCQNKN